MTDKQKQKIKDRIQGIKKTLAAEKKKFGWFDDSRGLRYQPPGLYVKIRDYAGGLKYLDWFTKNFRDDVGFPGFLFEASIIYFQTGNLNKSEDAALKTYFSNTFLIDMYFSKQSEKVNSNHESSDNLKNFTLRHDQDDLLEFSDWLNGFIQSDRFIKTTTEFKEIEKQLETEPVGPKRTMLVKKLHALI